MIIFMNKHKDTVYTIVCSQLNNTDIASIR